MVHDNTRRAMRFTACLACLIASFSSWPGPAATTPVSNAMKQDRQGKKVILPPILRTVRVGQDPIVLAIDSQTGRVFVANAGVHVHGTLTSSVSVLDATTGAVLHTISLGHDLQAVALDEQTRRVFVAGLATVSMLDARTGVVLHTFRPSRSLRGLAVDERHNHILVTARGLIYVLDATTGVPWSAIPVDGYDVAVDGRAGRIFVQLDGCAPSADALTTTACVDVLSTTGRQLGITLLPDFGDPVAINLDYFAWGVDERVGRAVIQYGDGRGGSYVGVVNTLTGKLVRTQPLGQGGGSVGTVAVDTQSGRAFVVTTAATYEGEHGAPNAVATVFDTKSGRMLTNVVVASAEFGSIYPAGVGVDTRWGRVYVVTTPYTPSTPTPPRSTLSVLDARSGHIVRTLMLTRVAIPLAGFSGPATAVDERTGRLFIANGTDNTVSVLDTARL